MRKYKGIEIGRLLFALLIPLLHISLPKSTGLYILQQYISRLGVPFFFAVSGMFLSKSIEKNGAVISMKKHIVRVGRVLLIWLLIYSPLIIRWAESYSLLIKQIFFMTPAYLWYLSSLCLAIVPFCLVKNRKVLYILAAVLYLFGTLFGDTYRWVIGGFPLYESIFLTTRNGLFFALPIMCVGELTWKSKKSSILLFIISLVLLYAEITFVGMHADKSADRSMYIFLPVFTYFLILMFRDWNPNLNDKVSCLFGGMSSAVYVMQFGVISAATAVLKRMGLLETNWMWIAYVAVVLIPVAIYIALRKTRIVKIVF